ncbi:hypothetical protein Leryth_007983 [Lithospermum erythrorhizon]|nr:hypothetical protein Leryth_007983 [Lithospermum erythrorhizon]
MKKSKSQLQCEREKEIDEIHKKYAVLLQSVETDFMQKREDLLTSYNQVSKNKSVEVMMQMQSSAQNTGFEGTQKGDEQFVAPTSTTNTKLVIESTSLEPHQAVARTTMTVGKSSRNPCINIPPVALSVDAVDNLLTVTRPASSCGHRGKLSIPSIHFGGNLQTGGIVRATAPHLRNNRHQ